MSNPFRDDRNADLARIAALGREVDRLRALPTPAERAAARAARDAEMIRRLHVLWLTFGLIALVASVGWWAWRLFDHYAATGHEAAERVERVDRDQRRIEVDIAAIRQGLIYVNERLLRAKDGGE